MGDSAANGQVLEVVGGTDKGGIVVRVGSSLTSPEDAGGRLSTGAIVRELERNDAGRLRYKLLAGQGPDSGWVTATLKGKHLLVPAESSAWKQENTAPSSKTSSRKIRVLCLHGTASSPGVFTRQLRTLLQSSEKDIEFIFHGGQLRCSENDPVIGGQVKLVQQFFPHEVLTQYASPIRGFEGSDGDPTKPDTWRSYDGLEDTLKLVQECMRDNAPIDAVLGFSQGSNLASLVAAQSVCGKGETIRCVVHLCTSLPGWTTHEPWNDLFKEPLEIPALVVRGDQDTVAKGSKQVTGLYQAAEEVAQTSDHRPLPKDPKESAKVAESIRDFLLKHALG